MLKTFTAILLSAILLAIILTCANERAISGGPEDKEAPQILYSLPANESVNVDRKTEIFIKFNEQMQKSSFESSLQIWPRPPGDYEVKSSWTWLKIRFSEALDTNETYLLTLDKSAKDLRGNGLDATYVMAFSTGSDLNAGRLVGTIYGPADIKKNGDLLLYRQFDTDLSVLRQQDADYVFQPDDEGHFELPYLGERSYMLFYHWDRNQNKRIDGDDYFGRPEVATVWAKSDSLLKSHKIWPQVVPLKSLKLLKVTQLAGQLLQIRANRMVSEESLEAVDLFIDGVKTPILGSTKVDDDNFAMNLDIASPLKAGAQVWLHNFQDTTGFKLKSDTLTLTTPSAFDSLSLGKISVSWLNKDQQTLSGGDDQIHLKSKLPVLFKSDSAFSIVDKALDSVNIPGSLQKQNTMSWVFTADSTLEDGKTYLWEIDTRQIYAPLNQYKLDSLMVGSLKTVNPDSLGSLKLRHMRFDVLECRLSGKGVDRRFKLLPGEAISINDLPSQSYALVAFVDKDGDGRYLSGGMGPAAKSEPFWFYPDKIKIRARWETDLGIWLLHE
ncbi:MAG: Ig-like domain-containing protein [Candidatus Marinimicrobia bacterium]|nr:Ig-like domain-containing protein [Candidatus Neomarinimicrobiota bacterium]MCF7921490.1 Ig-like domain-containing protein [Candidatus Neomarinimicrobiota bacterium]